MEEAAKEKEEDDDDNEDDGLEEVEEEIIEPYQHFWYSSNYVDAIEAFKVCQLC